MSSIITSVYDWSQLASALYPTGFQSGYYSSTGAAANSTHLIRSRTYATFSADAYQIKVKAPSGYGVKVSEYDASDNYIRQIGSTVQSSMVQEVTVTLTAGYHYRFSFLYFSNGLVTADITTAIVDQWVCTVYELVSDTQISRNLVNYAVQLANNNMYRYYNAAAGESNLGRYTFDCATFNSYTIYLALGWTDWPSSSHGSIGYFWPYISQSGFDDFLTLNGFQKFAFSADLLTPGAIIITDETLHHSFMYIGNNQLVDANNYFGYGDNSIAVRSYPTYDPPVFAYIYLPPDVDAPVNPPGIPKYVPFYRHQRRLR